jgi:hypothetical protein
MTNLEAKKELKKNEGFSYRAMQGKLAKIAFPNNVFLGNSPLVKKLLI